MYLQSVQDTSNTKPVYTYMNVSLVQDENIKKIVTSEYNSSWNSIDPFVLNKWKIDQDNALVTFYHGMVFFDDLLELEKYHNVNKSAFSNTSVLISWRTTPFSLDPLWDSVQVKDFVSDPSNALGPVEWNIAKCRA